MPGFSFRQYALPAKLIGGTSGSTLPASGTGSTCDPRQTAADIPEGPIRAQRLEARHRSARSSSRVVQPIAYNLAKSVEADYDLNTRITALQELKVSRRGEDCLVVIHTPVQADLGRRYLLGKPALSIGRGRDNDIVLMSDCVSRHHSRIEQRGDAIFVVDLNSTNGTYVNDDNKSVRERSLKRGDQLKVGDIVFKYLSGSDVEAQYHEIIFRMTVTDGLTDLCNRKQLDNLLAEEIPRALRHGRELSLLMLDIDHFKRINDTYGHLTGDSVLRGMAGLLQKRLRPNDRLGRYGGEEFCAILPETSLANAQRIAEELRALVQSYVFVSESKELRVTISVGAAALKSGMQSSDLYQAADEMLYRAKRSGRNRVCC